jgi:hypothetical protein
MSAFEKARKLIRHQFPVSVKFSGKYFSSYDKLKLSLHIYLGMKHSLTLSVEGKRHQKIIDFKWKQILNVKWCLMFLIKKATRCETENGNHQKYLKAFATVILKCEGYEYVMIFSNDFLSLLMNRILITKFCVFEIVWEFSQLSWIFWN